ncbi:MAG: rhodanese-like domain-containing protein [Bacteroidales bacterium]
MKMIFILSLMLLPAVLKAQDPPLQNPPQKQTDEKEIIAVDPDQVRLELALEPAAILIDARLRFEHRRRRIENSVNLPDSKTLNEFATTTSKGRPLYVYCTTEPRARQAAELLLGHGFEKVFIIEGGFNKWRAYNLPIVKGRKGRRN